MLPPLVSVLVYYMKLQFTSDCVYNIFPLLTNSHRHTSRQVLLMFMTITCYHITHCKSLFQHQLRLSKKIAIEQFLVFQVLN